MSASSGVYGLGVGPGDPGLLTVRGAELLRAAQLVIAPRATAEHASVARGIAAPYLSSTCEVVECVFPMSDDSEARSAAARDAADMLAAIADEGGVAVMITLGDPMTYSTWGYVLRELNTHHCGVPIQTVPGVTSFSAAAARLGEPLAEGGDPLLVWPATLPAELDALLEVAPNVVALKAGRRLESLVHAARTIGARVGAVRRLGLDGEQVATDASRLLEGTTDYLTTAIVHKENR